MRRIRSKPLHRRGCHILQQDQPVANWRDVIWLPQRLGPGRGTVLGIDLPSKRVTDGDDLSKSKAMSTVTKMLDKLGRDFDFGGALDFLNAIRFARFPDALKNGPHT